MIMSPFVGDMVNKSLWLDARVLCDIMEPNLLMSCVNAYEPRVEFCYFPDRCMKLYPIILGLDLVEKTFLKL